MGDAQRFAGRVALITGGASGIGLATARRMSAEGGRVVLWDVDAAALERARAEFGAAALCQRVDVTREDDVATSLAGAMAQLGRLDIVVNSAGITGPTEPFWQHSTASWRKVLDLNLDAVFFASRAAVPHLIAAGGGHIVNLASIAGKEGNRHQAAYSASKAGVIGLTKSMGKDLVEHNILVNAVAPAAIEGELIKQMPQSQIDFVRAKIPMNRLGRLEEVAALVCWLASDDCSFNTGAVFDLSGGRATY
jgi:2-dehydro-3-deoxy-L-rhamnonate dehydrogenase (NAD+)